MRFLVSNPCNSIQEIGFADGSMWGLSHFS
jgi:hypothetical protein